MRKMPADRCKISKQRRDYAEPIHHSRHAAKPGGVHWARLSVTELGDFTEEEALHFLAVHHPQVNFTETELKFINSCLDPHPLKLQILCDQVLQNRARQWRDDALLEEVVKVYRQHLGGKYELKNLRKIKCRTADGKHRSRGALTHKLQERRSNG
jgi:hypothetical protein